jgi:NADPH:quinone reductase-like Zn-dependent oxidoreductase
MNIVMAFHSYGPPEVLEAIAADPPRAAEGQVRIRVLAAGVQPVDTYVRSGRFAARLPPVPFPQTLGNEFAGVVDEVGDGVTEVTAGDEVIGFTLRAAYATFVVVPASHIVPKPPEMPWREAGALSASGQTACTALKDLRVGRGETVLIHAAAGGVGTIATQLARVWGATVIGTASAANHDYLRALGAIPVTYGDGLIERVRVIAPDGVDAVLDAIGGPALPASIAVAKQRDRIGSIADPAAASALGVRFLQTRRSREQLLELLDLYRAGQLKVMIWKSFPMADAARAHREVETGHVRGKVVLTAHGI